jgi:hypothetical protein
MSAGSGGARAIVRIPSATQAAGGPAGVPAEALMEMVNRVRWQLADSVAVMCCITTAAPRL